MNSRNHVTAEQIANADAAVTAGTATTVQHDMLSTLTAFEIKTAIHLTATGGGDEPLTAIRAADAAWCAQRDTLNPLAVQYFWLGAGRARVDVHTPWLERPIVIQVDASTAGTPLVTVQVPAARLVGAADLPKLQQELERAARIASEPMEIIRWARRIHAAFHATR